MILLKALRTVLTHPTNQGKPFSAVVKVLWWKLNQVFLHHEVIVPLHQDIHIICPPAISYAGFMVYTGWPEFYEMKFVSEFLRPTSVTIDVGSHMGDYSLLAAAVSPKGKIFACEPTPTMVQLIKRNIHLNHLEKTITVIPKALSNKSGFVQFTLEPESEVNHITTDKAQKSTRIPATTIDALTQQYRLANIDLLKIDVEGAESVVLSGAKRTLKTKKVAAILFEVNQKSQQFSHSTRELLELITQYGYNVFQFDGCILRRVDLDALTKLPTYTHNLLAVRDSKLIRRTKNFKVQ
jgi:FkbM family methyltransferase